jgi:hypothetical protein
MNEQEKLINHATGTEENAGGLPVSSIIPGGITYYPQLGKHESFTPWLLPYAAACVEIVKLLNDTAVIKYKLVVEACKTPEIQALWESLKAAKLSNNELGIRNALQGFHTPVSLRKAMEEFVFHGFNREPDIEFKTPKVVFDERKALPIALFLNAVTDAFGVDVPQHDAVNTLLYLFGSKPTNRRERRMKTSLRTLYRTGFGLEAVHKQTLMNGAEWWYKARVNPGKVVEVCNEFHLSNEPEVSRTIEPYDDAVGYPRHRNK